MSALIKFSDHKVFHKISQKYFYFLINFQSDNEVVQISVTILDLLCLLPLPSHNSTSFPYYPTRYFPNDILPYCFLLCFPFYHCPNLPFLQSPPSLTQSFTPLSGHQSFSHPCYPSPTSLEILNYFLSLPHPHFPFRHFGSLPFISPFFSSLSFPIIENICYLSIF